MMRIDRSNVVLVLVVVAAIAVAAVVAVHGHAGSGATAMSTYGAENPSVAGLADTSAVASSTGSGADALDPAKQNPTLDQFHSRNPFIQATGAPAASGSTAPTSEPTSSSTPTPTSTPVAADIRVKSGSVDGTYNDQKVGDKLPPAASVFKITSISSSGVVFELLNGYTLSNGTKTLPLVSPGAPLVVTLQNGSTSADYAVTVEKILFSGGSGSGGSGGGSGSGNGSGSGSGGGSGSSDVGHAIKAVSIETSNGVPSATLVVDGTTYAAKKVGAVVNTAWGQVKILGINAVAQTVTVLHADVQVTLHVGQSVSK
jgi:hypothetical protein